MSENVNTRVINIRQAWEYLTLELRIKGNWNELGARGWELVSVTSDFAHFKRPL